MGADGRRDSRFEAEAKYRALVEQIPGVVYLDPVDESVDSIFVSPQVRELLGVEPEDWIKDQYCWASHVHPDDFVRAWDDYMDCCTRGVPMSHEYRMVHEDGTIKWVLELARPINDEEGNPWIIQGVILDITSRKEAENLQTARSARLRSIVETQRDVAAPDLDVEAVMRSICERTQALTHAEAAIILMLDGEDLVIRVATGFLEGRVGARIPLEGSLPGWVYRHDRSTLQSDALADPRSGALAHELGIRSVVAVQLRHRDEAAAQLIVVSREPDVFDEEDLDTLELLSVVLSSALSHAAEFESKRRQVEALARFQTIYQGAAIGIAVVSSEGELLDANPAFVDMFGFSLEELRSDGSPDGTRPADLVKNDGSFAQMMDGGRDTYEQEKRFARKDGRLVWGHVAAALHRDPDGTPLFAICMIENITERKEAEERLAHLAFHDALTGLANRAGFIEVLDASVARARRLGLAVGVINLDLDNFRLVNDSLGHLAGDQLLFQLADRLRALGGGGTSVARQSSDEFLLLMSDLAGGPATSDGSEAALRVLEERAGEVHELLREPFSLEGVNFTISASLGIALFPRDATDAASLLDHADVAMYRSKAAGPGGTAVYSTARENPMLRLQLATQLRQAVERESWELHYQPVVSLVDGRIGGVEALIRGRSPNGELIPPGDFIPLAEEIGLIDVIGDWVIDEICRQARIWSDAGLTLEVGFNVSPHQLRSELFPERLLRRTEAAGVDAHHVVIEITESAVMTETERTQNILQSLHDAGFQIAIDDFGTGYSSLGRLKDLPIDILKIDRSFVRDARRDRDAGTMVQAIVQLAKNLGMMPLAEGVESTEDLAFLRAVECPVGQGFLFSRPLPATEITQLLAEGGSLGPPAASAEFRAS